MIGKLVRIKASSVSAAVHPASYIYIVLCRVTYEPGARHLGDIFQIYSPLYSSNNDIWAYENDLLELEI